MPPDLPPDIAALDEAAQEAPPSGELVERVRQKARLCRDTEQELADAETRVEELKARLNALRHKTLPDLFNQAKIDRFGLPPEGNSKAYDLRLSPWVECRLPKGREEIAYGWMETAGYGDIVKHTFTITFGTKSHDEATKLRQRLAEAGYEFEEKRSVHYQTLQAWAREQVNEYGATLPADILGLTIGQYVRVEERKEKVTKKRGSDEQQSTSY